MVGAAVGADLERDRTRRRARGDERQPVLAAAGERTGALPPGDGDVAGERGISGSGSGSDARRARPAMPAGCEYFLEHLAAERAGGMALAAGSAWIVVYARL